MSNLYVSEFGGLGATAQSDSVNILPPSLLDQKITFTGTHGESAAFGATTRFIEFVADGIMSFEISTAGTAATTSNMRAAAGERLIRAVLPGQKISAVTNT